MRTIVACALLVCSPVLGFAGEGFEKKILGTWIVETAPNRLVSRLVIAQDDKGVSVEVWAVRGLKEGAIHKAPLHLLRAGIGEKGPVERGLATWKEGADEGEATLFATLKFSEGNFVLELSKVYQQPKFANWFTSFVLKKEGQPNAKNMTDEQMLKQAVEVIAKEDANAKVTPVQSQNPHLGPWALNNPLPEYSFFCALLAGGRSVPNRRFLGVKRTGQVIDSFDGPKFSQLLAAADKAKWKDEDYRNAAVLWVHLMARANEDGWKVLEKPEDFTRITFNMESVGLGAAKQKESSKQIVPMKIERNGGQAMVTFYAWHLIGGHLRRWQLEIGPKMAATKRELGQFGGGGYD
jgi:hypothetical protein